MTDKAIPGFVQNYAQTYEVAPDAVNRVRLELSALKQTGTLVDVTVGGISKLFKRVSWDELGIPTGDKRAQILRRGTKPLFPEMYYRPIQSMEVRVRNNLMRYSMDVQGFRPWRYIPVTAYFHWRDAHNSLVAEFNARVQALVDNYDQIVESVRTTFGIIADEAFDAIGARMVNDRAREVWKEHIINKAVGQLPSISDLTDPSTGLRVIYTTALIETQADIVKDEIDIHEKEIEAKNLRADIKRVREMRTIERGLIEQQFANMVSPFQEVMQQLEAQIAGDVKDVLDTIQKHGALPGRSADKARGIMELYKLMAVQSKPELEAALKSVQAALDTAPVREKGQKQLTYDAGAIKAALQQVATITHDSAQAELKKGVSRADVIDL